MTFGPVHLVVVAYPKGKLAFFAPWYMYIQNVFLHNWSHSRTGILVERRHSSR